MCEDQGGSYDKMKMVKMCRQDHSGRWYAPIDYCIAPIVQALNDAGIATIASCCGHGKVDGSIILADSRELLVKKN